MSNIAPEEETFRRQWWLIYSLLVAGKTFRFAESKMQMFCAMCKGEMLLEMVRRRLRAGTLGALLRNIRTGNYRKMERALTYLVNYPFDLAKCTPADLECVPGIGPKTSRHFILHTRPGARVAVLDVHILRWMAKQGYDVPRGTPTARKYARIEALFLAEADRRGMTAEALDGEIWRAASGYDDPEPIADAAPLFTQTEAP